MVGQCEIDQIHHSVLVDEVISFLSPYSGGTYIDGTMGLGGHTLEILERSKPEGKVVAFEWDKEAIALAKIRLRQYERRLIIIHNSFAEIVAETKKVGIKAVDGILVDIGLSSLQLDSGGRGFSFRKDEQLDMRMDIRRKTTAASIVNNSTEAELADIFFYYGEEKQARPIAKRVVEERKRRKITSSKQLADLVATSVPKRFHPKKIHVATRVFQALRIAVNSELENLAVFLDNADCLLRPGARLCVISFHSLEDRLVKRKFNENKWLDVLTSSPIVPGAEEIIKNSRSRSARLRVAVKKNV